MISFIVVPFILVAVVYQLLPYTTSNHTIYKKVAQQAEPNEVVSQPSPVIIKTDVVDSPQPPKKEYDQPIPGSEKIIMRADSILNSEKSCHKIMTLGLAISEDYNQAMTSLKNRAFLVGGNAIAVLKLYEDHDAFAAATSNMTVEQKESHISASNVSGIVGNIYQCL